MSLKEQSISPPRLLILSLEGNAIVQKLGRGALSCYAEPDFPEGIDDLTAPLDDPMAPTVVLVDFRTDPDQTFCGEDLRRLGRIQTRLPQAVVVLLTSSGGAQIRQLAAKTGVRHMYSAPVDWEVLGSHLKGIAQRLSKRSGVVGVADSNLLEVCLAIGSTLELEPLLDKIMGLMIADLMAHQGSILLFDRETDQLKMLASRGLPPHITKNGYIPRKGSIAEYVIEHNEPLMLNDTVDDARFSSVDGRSEIVSSMCVPLRAKGAVQGTINLNRLAPAEPFGESHKEAAMILATQAAISIENARLYEANLQAERLATVGQTVAGVSHSMKSIITSLRGGVTICEEARTDRDWDTMDKGWGLVMRNMQRLSSMAMEMLDYSKENRETVKEEFEVEPVIRETFATVGSKAEIKNVELSSSIDIGAETLCGDQDQTFRAVLNLVENAIDAIDADSGGTVDVSVHMVKPGNGHAIPIDIGQSLGAVFIEVTDNGPGISDENKAKIFAPFFSTKGSKGTGLGLASTQKIIREHGGEIILESEPGAGAKFTIVLPK